MLDYLWCVRIVCDFFVEKCIIMCVLTFIINLSLIDLAVVSSKHLPKAKHYFGFGNADAGLSMKCV